MPSVCMWKLSPTRSSNQQRAKKLPTNEPNEMRCDRDHDHQVYVCGNFQPQDSVVSKGQTNCKPTNQTNWWRDRDREPKFRWMPSVCMWKLSPPRFSRPKGKGQTNFRPTNQNMIVIVIVTRITLTLETDSLADPTPHVSRRGRWERGG